MESSAANLWQHRDENTLKSRRAAQSRWCELRSCTHILFSELCGLPCGSAFHVPCHLLAPKYVQFSVTYIWILSETLTLLLAKGSILASFPGKRLPRDHFSLSSSLNRDTVWEHGPWNSTVWVYLPGLQFIKQVKELPELFPCCRIGMVPFSGFAAVQSLAHHVPGESEHSVNSWRHWQAWHWEHVLQSSLCEHRLAWVSALLSSHVQGVFWRLYMQLRGQHSKGILKLSSVFYRPTPPNPDLIYTG